MRTLTIVLLLLIGILPTGFAQDAQKPIAVVELFTSEGSADCPAADMLLAKLAIAAREQDVRIYPLSFHVDYWNRFGWRDPFSQKDFSLRQEWYAKQIGSPIELPQMIINGQRALSGLNSKEVQVAVNKALREPASVLIGLSLLEVNQKRILASFSLNGDWKGKRLVVAFVERGVSVDVARGANAGRRLKHEHVVKQFQVLAPDQNTGSFIFTSPPLSNLDRFSIIAFMQDTDVPEITGAMQLDLPTLAK